MSTGPDFNVGELENGICGVDSRCLLDSCEIALDSLRLPLLRFWQWSLRSGGWCRSEASSHRHGR